MKKSVVWYFFQKIWDVLVCFGLFRNSLFQIFLFYTETGCFDVLIVPKQTEDQPKQYDREHILVFFRKFRVVSVCFGLFRNSSVCFGCFDIGSKHRNRQKQNKIFGTETDLFQFVCSN